MALNEVVEPDKKLAGGIGFEGSLFIEFENGGALWQLSWRTPESGVTLYRWSYRRKKPDASWKERAAQKQEELPREEIEQRGELAEQALRAGPMQGTNVPRASRVRSTFPWTAAERMGGVCRSRSERNAWCLRSV
jgi:hypothetical protein